MIETVDEFIRLVESDDPVDRRRAAWEGTNLGVWMTLITHHPEMHFWVAHNRTIPSEVMRELASDDDWRVRDRIATKNSCPSEILEILSHDSHDAVASAVAGHPNTPSSALRRLAEYPWSQVRNRAIQQLADRGELDEPRDPLRQE